MRLRVQIPHAILIIRFPVVTSVFMGVNFHEAGLPAKKGEETQEARIQGQIGLAGRKESARAAQGARPEEASRLNECTCFAQARRKLFKSYASGKIC